MKNMHSDVRCKGLGKAREMRSKKISNSHLLLRAICKLFYINIKGTFLFTSVLSLLEV